MSLWCCGRERCALRLYIRAFFCCLFAGSCAASILVSSPARAQSQPGQWLPEITVSNPSRRAAVPASRPSPGPTAQQGGFDEDCRAVTEPGADGGDVGHRGAAPRQPGLDLGERGAPRSGTQVGDVAEGELKRQALPR